MKVIGTSAAGNPLIELEPADREQILAAGALLSRFPVIPVATDTVLPADAVRIQTVAVAKKATTKAKPTPQPAAQTSGDLCPVCGKEFIRSGPGGYKMTTCGADECKRTWRASIRNSRRARKEVSAAPGNRQGGKLGFRKCVTCGKEYKVKHVDQQHCSESCRRKVDKSARLAMLKDAAARVGITERDPLAEADRVARNIEREERGA